MVLAAWNQVAESRGKTAFTRNRFIALTVRPAVENFLEMYGDDHASARAEFETILYASERNPPRILPGTIELLDWVRSNSIPMGVVSNKQARLVREEIKLLGWDDYFSAVAGSGDAAFDKPRPDPILYVLREMKIQPGKEAWMIGDMESDIAAANAAGITSVLIETTASLNLGLEGNLDAHKPDLRVSDARALLALLTN